jgi:hypothetical protein
VKTAKEIREMRQKWLDQNGYGLGIEYLFQAVIGLAEHMDAATPTINDRITLASLNAAERQGAIKALRWALGPDVDLTEIEMGLRRLENGGDL